jgi:hypothetical protein
VSQETTPFPLFLDDPYEDWRWPTLPFEWSHASPDSTEPRPCRVEDLRGHEIDAHLIEIDPLQSRLSIRTAALPQAVHVPLNRVRRLTLTEPLVAAPRIPRGRLERLPVAAQEREVSLHFSDDAARVALLSVGLVERPEGLYLFPPRGHDDLELLRVFVPRAVLRQHAAGPTATERATERWLCTPADLLAAIERQPQMPVLPIGQALLNLGLITPAQLDRALVRQTGDKPLGQMLVDAGLVSRSDLHTALGHKMGYPLVDLSRFPIDPAAASRLPLRVAAESRALPLMSDGTRLIVAVDRLARLSGLRALHVFEKLRVVPVLASKGQLMLALQRLSRQDMWGHQVPQRLGFADSTTA